MTEIEKTKVLTIATIVSEEFGISLHEMFSRSRKSEMKDARHLFRALTYNFTRLTLVQICQFEGQHGHKPDEATITHSKQVIRDWESTSDTKFGIYQILKRKVSLAFTGDINTTKLRVIAKLTTCHSFESLIQVLDEISSNLKTMTDE